jgi:hypothetical protein
VSKHRKIVESESGPEGQADVQSDPAKGADDGKSDWADEGGATETGPAT